MEDQLLSHYRILERLGGGGMGVVYKAEDTRLRRVVALKFLPPELTRDVDARARFVQEAQTASALDHPNICTIHEIDNTVEDRLFIAMGYYDGETLERRLARGPLPVAEAVDFAVQTLRGLEKAHRAGVVHCDITPANLMLTTDGPVKILDFGIAKLLDHTTRMQTGPTFGTVAYMAPERVSGAAVDERADVWAVGVVLWEMLTGRRPFGGDHPAAIMHNILHTEPALAGGARPSLPVQVARVVRRALEKDVPARYRSAAAMAEALAGWQGNTPESEIASASLRSRRRRIVLAAALAAVIVGAPAAWLARRGADDRRLEAAIADATELADRDEYAAAVARLDAAEPLARADERLGALWARISIGLPITSEPAGAEVSIKPYDDSAGAWRSLGRTPLSVRLPRGAFRWRVEKEGFEVLDFLAVVGLGPAQAASPSFALTAKGTIPDGMVLFRRPNLNLALTGYDYQRTIPAGDFAIDKYEVTNRQYQAFVDRAGYTKREYWTHAFVRDGSLVSWDEAMEQFRDRTGRPGPSTWEVGRYPAGQDDYPVGGVSWYEAAAYAEFAGKRLPTIYHWLAGAGVQQATYITSLSNLSGKGPAPVGHFGGVSGAGLLDAAGNVREWCWNEIAAESDRYILGGSWQDPGHMFFHADARPPFDRSPNNGFRLATYLDSAPLPDALTAIIPAPRRDYANETPVEDQVFEAFREIYRYDRRPLDTKVESRDETAPQWVKEKVSFTATYADERVTAYVFLPKGIRPPYQAIVFAPGSGAITTPSSEHLQFPIIDFAVLSGRAVIYPIYKGTYERNSGQTGPWPDSTRAYQEWVLQIVNDARRSVDYLESRADIRRNAVAFYGFSWGTGIGIRALALDTRFKTAVLMDGGLSPASQMPPHTDQINFAPRITIPTLLVNGSWDYIYPLETSQKPLLAMLGTSADRKRHVVLPAGHGAIGQQRSQVVREVLDWLDAYLGAVEK